MNINKQWAYKHDKFDIDVDVYTLEGWGFRVGLEIPQADYISFVLTLFKIDFRIDLSLHK